MTDRRSFTVTVVKNQFVVTYSDGSLYVCNTDDFDLVTDGMPLNLVRFGPAANPVDLVWRLETGLSATSRADFVAKIQALAARDVSLSTVLGRAASGETVRVTGWCNVSSSGWRQASYNAAENFLASAAPVRLRSFNAADVAVSGAGARTVLVEGLDANGAEISETLSCAGVGYSSYTSQSFLRINRATVASTGTDFGKNYNLITVEDSGSNVLRTIAFAESSTPGATYGAGVSEDGTFAVPAGYTAYVMGAAVSSTGSGSWALYKHSFASSPTPRVRLCQYYKPSVGQMAVEFATPFVVDEKTDLTLRVNNSVAAGGWFDVVLVPT